MIRVISIGDDGASHHDALKRLATGNVASVIGNHCAPVLEWLYWNDVSFAVFPYLSAIDPTRYWIYEDVEDLLKHLLQMFEVSGRRRCRSHLTPLQALEFCHSRLVAHRASVPYSRRTNLTLFVGRFRGQLLVQLLRRSGVPHFERAARSR